MTAIATLPPEAADNGLASLSSTPPDRLVIYGPAPDLSGGVILHSQTVVQESADLQIAGSTILLSPTKAVEIEPTPLSDAKGLAVSQTGPLYPNETTGFFAFNSIGVEMRNTVTGDDNPGNAGSAGRSAFSVNVTAGGDHFLGNQTFGIAGAVNVDASTPQQNPVVYYMDYVGGSFAATTKAVPGNPTNTGNLYGCVGAAVVLPNGRTPNAVGFEADMAILEEDTQVTGDVSGRADNRYAFHAGNQGALQAVGRDAAFAVFNSGPAAGAYKDGLLFWNASAVPIDPTGSVVRFDGAMTVKNVLNLDNLTVTGNIIKSANVNLTGSGVLSLTGVSTGVAGIGNVPTTYAWLTLGGSTSTVALMNLPDGVAPTYPHDGDVWREGTALKTYFGGTVRTITQV